MVLLRITTEYRESMKKLCCKQSEESKVKIRHIRKSGMDDIKSLSKTHSKDLLKTYETQVWFSFSFNEQDVLTSIPHPE